MNRPADEVPLAAQIQEIEREIALRNRVYPGLQRMRQGEKDEHMRRIRAVLETLKGLTDDNR